ncbi:acyl-CoA thioesterase/BAAT N-terminal domain-containing protein [Halogeometricum sp. S1BR25-6]|uniref:Acyl-CoA thioesterase/BAAT N-terminal domain-containing protein n=1 Tax=Halogeometricum salsisoli TaxID=2950536 RepID=A0ABU2GC58_9EURY|nr:acyl-CoA thioester hydrolase/BAAT C-terminal domain-containing protein [Halogeometricum sp. S1BR25-6]MDS0298400.1 acyl-CoA thioesterase/BAAT N-terminal domain-containing protein [Halogeometricum sp. S1BR25-6]
MSRFCEAAANSKGMDVGSLSDRRAYLRAVGGLGLASLAGCVASDAAPSVAVPSSALTDEPVPVVVKDLDPGASVTLRATARSRSGRRWESRADFVADDGGVVDVSERAPLGGTYDCADATGPFWSMRPADAPDGPLPPGARFTPPEGAYDVALAAERGGETLASATMTRLLFDPDVESRPVGDGLAGRFFAPPGDDPVPAVVHLHGAAGRPHLATGRLLASRGIAALTLQYFGDPEPTPDTLTEVPVEYVERAVSWLLGRDRVVGSIVGLFGFSRGGSLALLAASRSDAVGAVVGWVPSGLVWEGLGRGRAPAGTSAWSVDGEPIPFLELADADPGPPPTPALPYYEPALVGATEAQLDAAAIAVEDADAPVYLVSATDDARWPSTAFCDRVVDRLDAANYAREYRHDRHSGAGHYLRLPYLPTPGVSRDRLHVYGGTPAANARASAAAWSETVAFFRRSLSA